MRPGMSRKKCYKKPGAPTTALNALNQAFQNNESLSPAQVVHLKGPLLRKARRVTSLKKWQQFVQALRRIAPEEANMLDV